MGRLEICETNPLDQATISEIRETNPNVQVGCLADELSQDERNEPTGWRAVATSARKFVSIGRASAAAFRANDGPAAEAAPLRVANPVLGAGQRITDDAGAIADNFQKMGRP